MLVFCRMPCTPWQSTQVATLALPILSCCPCFEVQYSLMMSTGAAGLKRFMYVAEAWQRPQKSGILVRSGLPTYGLALNAGSMAPAGSSASFGSGLPPWQSWQERPSLACTSSPKCLSFACAAASKMSEVWQETQDVLAG